MHIVDLYVFSCFCPVKTCFQRKVDTPLILNSNMLHCNKNDLIRALIASNIHIVHCNKFGSSLTALITSTSHDAGFSRNLTPGENHVSSI
jgi:hypothetical protein